MTSTSPHRQYFRIFVFLVAIPIAWPRVSVTRLFSKQAAGRVPECSARNLCTRVLDLMKPVRTGAGLGTLEKGGKAIFQHSAWWV